jgi:C_GCAxxG_C_C family probable redox protein
MAEPIGPPLCPANGFTKGGYSIVSSEDTRQKRIERVSTKAGDYEVESRNCAQGTLAALCEEFGLAGGGEALKAASFMPGVASSRETCGAVLGAVMAFGLAYGRDHLSDPEWTTPEAGQQWHETRVKVNSFCEAFRAEFGSLMCSVIRPAIMGRDYNPLDPEDRRQFALDGGVEKCRLPPEVAARIAATMLLEE